MYDDDLILQKALKLDILVNDEIIIELKAQGYPHPIWKAQLLSHLKLADIRLGFLINFHVPLMKDGIKRIIV
jgi:GxxExxY protein